MHNIIKPLFFYPVMVVVLLSSTTFVADAASDPTKPLFGQVVAPTAKVKSRLVLQSIIKSDKGFKVVINGKLLTQGGVISGYKIKTISSQKVLLVSDERQLKLSLFTQNRFSKAVKN